jgi:methionine biosynthesis protein MetW
VRDSALKRALVNTYFNWHEVSRALAGMIRPATFGKQVADYDGYWRHRGPSGMQPRFTIIGHAIASGASVIDIGCGDGVMLEFLKATRNVRELGIDLSDDAVRRARDRGVNARVEMLGDLAKSGAKFDHVVMSEVVEHVADAEQFVLDAWTLTSKTLWLTFPNIAYFPHRLRLAAGKAPVQWVVFPGEHLRFWSVPDFRAWLVSLSLPQPAMTASNGFTVGRLHRIWPNLFGNQIVVRCDR